MLAMGKSDDEMFVDLKNYLIFPDRIEYGYCTNNSITIDQNLDEYKHIIKRIKQNGEPVFYLWIISEDMEGCKTEQIVKIFIK